jgi:hypothetical protein
MPESSKNVASEHTPDLTGNGRGVPILPNLSSVPCVPLPSALAQGAAERRDEAADEPGVLDGMVQQNVAADEPGVLDAAAQRAVVLLDGPPDALAPQDVAPVRVA